MFEALKNVDWDLLYQQKLMLLKVRERYRRGSDNEQALSGIIHLLDALQDEAKATGLWEFPNERGRKRGGR